MTKNVLVNRLNLLLVVQIKKKTEIRSSFSHSRKLQARIVNNVTAQYKIRIVNTNHERERER